MKNYGGECGITTSKLYYDLKKNAELDQKFQEGKSFPFRFCSELHLLPQDSGKKFPDPANQCETGLPPQGTNTEEPSNA